MTAFDLSIDWQTDPGCAPAEIDKTHALLRITAGNQCITEALHRASDTVTSRIHVSLYPLAEWIAGNWWFLTEEAETPLRCNYAERHSLKHGRGGYCVPDLRLTPEGESYLLRWVSCEYTHAPLEFTRSGSLRLTKREVVEPLRKLVNDVVRRLEDRGVYGTWLQEEWKAIEGVEADAQQLAYCKAAGWLGRDPFDTDLDELKDLVDLQVDRPALFEDLLRAVRAADLSALVLWTRGKMDQGAMGKNEVPRQLRAMKESPSVNGDRQRPWETGYASARAVLERIGVEDLLQAVHVEATDPPPAGIEGLTRLNGELVCYTHRRREETKRFLIARSLFDFLRLEETHSLLTDVPVTRQREGRAFAAELLAPSEKLRERVSHQLVKPEEIGDLAEEFRVSEYVIRHQLKNHRIAQPLDEW